MKKFDLDPIWIILMYPIMFVVTYGHAYKSVPDTYVSFGMTLQTSIGTRAIEAFFASCFWPLYWSVKMWS